MYVSASLYTLLLTITTASDPLDAVLAAQQEGMTLASQGKISERDERLCISETYDRVFGPLPERFQELPSEQLTARYRAAELIAHYTLDPARIDHAESIAAELDRRGSVGREDRRRFLAAAWLAVRREDRARALLGADADTVPRLRLLPQQHGPSVLRTEEEGRVLVQEPFETAGLRLVVVVHPQCGYSREALAALENDPAFESLRSHVQLLVPQEPRLSFADIAAWNARHTIPMRVAFDRERFDWVDSWATPTFYLLRDGRVVGRVAGWPGQHGNRDALLALWRSTGRSP